MPVTLFASDFTGYADTDLSKLACSEFPDVAAYFKFVLETRQILMIWKDKFATCKINNSEIGIYREHWKAISVLGESLDVSSSVVTRGDVDSRGQHFLELFEKLNIALIRYIRGEDTKRLAKYYLSPVAYSFPIYILLYILLIITGSQQALTWHV